MCGSDAAMITAALPQPVVRIWMSQQLPRNLLAICRLPVWKIGDRIINHT